MYGFGVGNVFLIPPTVGGTTTPIQVATLQEVSLDVSFETKTLYGNLQFPVAIGRGKGKISGKAKTGEFQGALIQSLLTGATTATGQTLWLKEKAATVASGKYTASKSATWVKDLGALDDNLLALTNITTASTPTVGQYNVSATGVYLFTTTATSNYSVKFEYTDSTSGSQTIDYDNQLMGQGSSYLLELFNTNPDGSTFGLRLYSVVFSKLTLPLKADDFVTPDLDFEAFADSSGNVLQFFTSKA
jgi:hypothetical protein